MRLIAVITLLLGACVDVGDVTHGLGNPDGGGGGSGCINMTTPLTIHSHASPVDLAKPSNQGQNCMGANCHNAAVPGAGATPYTFAGTLFTTAGGTTGAGGVSVRVKSGGTVVTVVTDSDGNFYSTGAVAFPASTDVTSCPTVHKMTGQLQTGNGACNNTGCHAVGGSPGPIGLN
jgi:hypothetical protein